MTGRQTTSRSILTGIVILALVAGPLAVAAQSARLFRVGVVHQGGIVSRAVDGLRDGLRELGLEEGNFAINMKTAKALGLTIPQSTMARVDEVIE